MRLWALPLSSIRHAQSFCGCINIILIGFACPHSVFKAPKWYADIPVRLCSMHNHEKGSCKLCFYSFALWVHKCYWIWLKLAPHTQHHQMIAIHISKQFRWILVLNAKINYITFAVVCFWGLSDIHEYLDDL